MLEKNEVDHPRIANTDLNFVGEPSVGLIFYNPTPFAKEGFHPKLFLLGFSHRRTLNSHHGWALAVTHECAVVCHAVAHGCAVVSHECAVVTNECPVVTHECAVVPNECLVVMRGCAVVSHE